ncbi:unnamed protein product [marine sediment metagenome]|uniref:Uncharacterized protein n=1 Tax=marine sediment metagenome TaxID=412755 RepID=X1GKS8_9ZZZZ
MAERAYQVIENPWSASGIILIKWEGLTKATDDTGVPYICPHYADKSVQLIGELGVGGVCTIEGSNMKDSSLYATLNDPQGNILTMSTLKIETILENIYLIRPKITAGDALTDLDVYMLIFSAR